MNLEPLMGSFNVSEEIPRLVYMKAPPPGPYEGYVVLHDS